MSCAMLSINKPNKHESRYCAACPSFGRTENVRCKVSGERDSGRASARPLFLELEGKAVAVMMAPVANDTGLAIANRFTNGGLEFTVFAERIDRVLGGIDFVVQKIATIGSSVKDQTVSTGVFSFMISRRDTPSVDELAQTIARAKSVSHVSAKALALRYGAEACASAMVVTMLSAPGHRDHWVSITDPLLSHSESSDLLNAMNDFMDSVLSVYDLRNMIGSVTRNATVCVSHR